MDLILWRHAEAEDVAPDHTDAGRRLTPHGKEQAEKIAAWLDKRLPADTRILASPATRTRQTADALKRSYAIEADLFTDAGVDELLALCQAAQAGETLLLIGHQPTLGQTVARLLCGEAQAWSVKKGAIWWLSTRVREAHPQTVLKIMLTPELI